MAALPAEASEVVSDAMAGLPAAAAVPAAGDALAAAQTAVESDPTDLVFTALFTIASEPGARHGGVLSTSAF